MRRRFSMPGTTVSLAVGITVRVLRSLAAAIALLTGIVVLPGLLMTLQAAAWSNIDWAEVTAQPLCATTAVLVAVGVGWLVWGWLLVATISDVVAAVRGVGFVRARLPVPLHHAVSAVAGSVAMLLQSSAALAAVGTGPISGEAGGHVSVQASYPASLPPAAAIVTGDGKFVLVESTASGGPALQPRMYTVRQGDVLSRIAAREIGDAKRWPEIFALNKGAHFDHVGGTFTNPNLIYPGWTLRLPGVEPAVPAPTESDPVHEPVPQSTADELVGPTAAASTSPTVTADVSGASSPPTAHASDADGAGGVPWLLLAGGAAAVGAAAVARHRRSRLRRVSPTTRRSAAARPPIPDTDTGDSSLHRRSVRAAGRSEVAAGAAASRSLASPTSREARPVKTHAVPTSGAIDAGVIAAQARIAALLRDGGGSTAVVISADTLAVVAPGVSAQAGLTVTGTLGEAIRLLETETLHRTRILLEHDVTDIADVSDIDGLAGSADIAADGAAAGLPAVTYIVQPSEEHSLARITALLDRCLHLGIDGIVLDAAAGPARSAQPDSRRSDVVQDEPPTPPADAGRHLARARIQVLGHVAVLDADSQPVAGMRGHALELLTYLAVHRAGAALPDIMEAIWPDATVTRAGQRLSTVVGNLRQSIRAAAGDPTMQPVVNTGGRYHLDPDLDIDVWQLDDALSTARHSPARREVALRTAVAVHTGDLAGDLPYAWIDSDRQAYRQQGIAARRQLAELLSYDRAAEAAALLEAAADLDPANEALARDAIAALARVGDTDRVNARWDRLKAALADIGERPEEASVALYTQLQRRSPARAGRRTHV
jgi:DNA-binding SARP family transcriptional activator